MDHILGLKCTICGAEYKPDHVEYVCPMHADVISKEPGSCPICGMDLVLKEVEEAEAADT